MLNNTCPITQRIKALMVKEADPRNITILDLSGIKSASPHLSIEACELLQQCSNLTELNLSNCGLLSLDNIPQSQRLAVLILNSNHLTDSEISKLGGYGNSLEQLCLKNNKIKMGNTLCQLRQSGFDKLQQLDINGNPLSSHDNSIDSAAKLLFQCFPNLKIVDYYLRNGDILSDEDNNDEDLMAEEFYDEESSDQNEQRLCQETFEEIMRPEKYVDPMVNCLTTSLFGDGQMVDEEELQYSGYVSLQGGSSKKIKSQDIEY